MKANLQEIIDSKVIELRTKIIDLDPNRRLFGFYRQWLIDDAGCDLISFIPEEYFSAEYPGLEELCWGLQAAHQALYELDRLANLAYIGEQFQDLINLAT